MQDNLGMYKICTLINLDNWKKQKEIIEELHREYCIVINSRQWRKAVEIWNKKFVNGEVNVYITHSNSKGFKATTSYEEAKFARNDYFKRGVNMLKKARECDIAFRQKCNYQIDFEKGEII